MAVITRVLGTVEALKGRFSSEDALLLTSDERASPHMVGHTQGGRSLRISLPRESELNDGDVLEIGAASLQFLLDSTAPFAKEANRLALATASVSADGPAGSVDEDPNSTVIDIEPDPAAIPRNSTFIAASQLVVIFRKADSR